ncbi:hypothetical protein D3C81_958430 [compost metagenome]
MQQQCSTNAHRRAGYSGNYRFAALKQVEHEVKHRAVEVTRRLLDEVGNVVAGGEAFGAAGNQHGVDRRVAIGLFQRLGEATVHGAGQGVFLVRTVEAQGQQTALAFQQDGFGHDVSRV